jgi:ketosteroid isomerase-like protein
MEGARAALETFYRAFNTRDLDLLTTVWLDDPLVQLNNPVGGLLRGRDAIADLYARVFQSEAGVWVQFEDIVEVATETCAIFAGRERGEFTAAQETLTLQIRTSRCFVYAEQGGGWRQVHHHGSIDDP